MDDDEWDEFIIEGDALFDYMIHNFDNMFDGDIIKHFEFREQGVYDNGTEKVAKKYGNEIKKELRQWIHQEFKDNQLFKKNYWKPFRDVYMYKDMYLGYRILFPFKQYYFQLVLNSFCGYNGICSYCKYKDRSKNFQLILLGWKDDEYEMMQPDNRAIVYPDNIVPDWYWERNN
jgi:hypothetical protein